MSVDLEPAAPVLGPAFLALGACLTFVVCWVADKGFRALFAPTLTHIADLTLGRVFGHGGISPFKFLHAVVTDVNRWTKAGMTGSERAIVNGFGTLLWAFYDLGFTIVKLAYDTNTALDNVWARVTRDAPAVGNPAANKRVAKLQAREAALEHRVGRLEHAKRGGAAALGAQDWAKLNRGIDRLQRELTQVQRQEHAQAKTKTHAGTTVITDVVSVPHWVARRLSRIEKATVGVGAAALVATALGTLGLGWLHCRSLKNIGKRLGCVGFGWLEAFFATTFEAMVVLDLCKFALAAQRLAKKIVPYLAGTLLVQDAVCLGGGASYPSAHDSPKVLTTITKPSAHD